MSASPKFTPTRQAGKCSPVNVTIPKKLFTPDEANAFFKYLIQDDRAQSPSFSDTRIAIDSYGGAINNKCDTNNGFDP
ncbi:hypothetical protein CES85_3229 (plasmid) [Ochrobactrum quorumnocens]|uniref:Uncharacterized protein n=1 Tax=Ochrobactrum quorumnocens TaxID=271865 RepID=A0A248UMJ7_9HYPH|nr:hypothetical protein [[Ochrobactrum] quorumnocens]ASV87955.1 hypothetical protein CES85_3229 [[Ochrobactrum] quorumnocens]